MTILKTIIRVLLVIICIALFVFLSITLFKYIPKAINQLASATVSLGKVSKTATSTDTATNSTQRSATIVESTENGLNGVVTQTNSSTSTSGIMILDKKTSTSQGITEKPTTSKSTADYRTPTYIYQPPQFSGRKNLSVISSGLGIIDPSSGTFIITNNIRSTDTVVLKFTVLNTEDTPTGIWSMQVNMPTTDSADKIRTINNIASIPGQSSYTVEARFNGVDLTNGTPIIRVYVDVSNQVAETNENDNSLAVSLNTVQPNGSTYTGGLPNLNIVSIETGRMFNGNFSPTTSFTYGESITLKVRIRNTGGSFSNSWSTRGYFNNTESGYKEFSTTGEQPIRAGGEDIFYYTINNIGHGSNTFNLTVDSSNTVYEANESDNSSSVTAYVNY